MKTVAALHLLRCITPRRALNLVLALLSYKLSDRTGRTIVWGMPYTLTIEPTNLCNLRCPECPSGNGTMTRPSGMMSLDFYKRLIDDIKGDTFYLQLFFQGEPTINPLLPDMIRYARTKRMYVSASTNANFVRPDTVAELLESGLDRLIVSLDGLSDETYRIYRIGGKLEKVLAALESIKQLKSRDVGVRSEIIIQFLVTRQNEHEIPEARALARRYGATLALKTIQVYSLEGAGKFLPENERYRRYRMEDGKLRVKAALKNRCVRLWERGVVTWDGTVVPCCFDKDARYPLGSTSELSFSEIWKSPAYQDFRRKILTDRRGVEMCTNCTEGLRVYR